MVWVIIAGLLGLVIFLLRQRLNTFIQSLFEAGYQDCPHCGAVIRARLNSSICSACGSYFIRRQERAVNHNFSVLDE